MRMLAAMMESLGISKMGKSLFKIGDPHGGGGGSPARKGRSSQGCGSLSARAIVKGGAAGAAAGAVVGGTGAYLEGRLEIANLPEKTLDLKWKEPLLQEKNIGQIPKNFYVSSGSGKMGAKEGYVPVNVKAPVFGYTGEPVMQDHQQSFKDHGAPVVTWLNHQIKDPFLTGYEEHVSEDGHYTNIGSGCSTIISPYPQFGSGGDCISVHNVDGYHHNFTPKIDYRVVGEYQTPQVTFETGVNIFSRTLWGVVLGMGAGALAGALLTALSRKAQKSAKQSVP